MVEFGDELVLESLRIPWLIWIQLLVMLLLLLLLYSFTSSNADSSSAAAAAAAAAPSSSSSSPSPPSPQPPPPLESRGSRSRKQQFLAAHGGAHQVGESQSVKGFIATSASRGVAGEEDTMEGENSSPSYMDHHPCSIVRLARIAFLKCFGLDFTSEDSSFKRHRR
ncbi:uncharacterized protein LOC130134371 isoform X2 [Syzygium oleosum]|uniref:uncharacterized protein LOC130134371 isoform X2 n=1 Tax=Syzygium oleosum TaxID=219896 RepID=UPI0024BA4CE6|nr:uncharacterized protein LOC130134371 isoform X2 [Syzygium oleosum]